MPVCVCRSVRVTVLELRGCLGLPQRQLQERLAETLTELLTCRHALRTQLAAAQVRQRTQVRQPAGSGLVFLRQSSHLGLLNLILLT